LVSRRKDLKHSVSSKTLTLVKLLACTLTCRDSTSLTRLGGEIVLGGIEDRVHGQPPTLPNASLAANLILRRQMANFHPSQSDSRTAAPEARQIVAHGETVGLVVKQTKPQPRRQKTNQRESLSPRPGLDSICSFPHGFTVGYPACFRVCLRWTMLCASSAFSRNRKNINAAAFMLRLIRPPRRRWFSGNTTIDSSGNFRLILPHINRILAFATNFSPVWVLVSGALAVASD